MRHGKVIGNQGVVCKTKRNERSTGAVPPERGRQLGTLEVVGAQSAGWRDDAPRAGIAQPHRQNQQNRDGGRDCQPGKGGVIIVPLREHERGQERTDRGADLVKRLVQAERPTLADGFPGLREHDIAGRIARRLADAFENDERRRGRPRADQCQSRYGSHLHDISQERDRPVPAAAIGKASRGQTQRVPE